MCTNESENNKKIYENTAEISKENSRNELLEEMTSADEANQARMQMILRNREELQEPKKFKDFVSKSDKENNELDEKTDYF